jgi:hypothetical protein
MAWSGKLPNTIRGGTVATATLDPQLTLRTARERYFSGEYVEATSLFASVAAQPGAPMGVRRDAFRYLARTYLERSQPDSAREALRSLLDLEPPMALLVPSLESQAMMDLYYEVRRDKARRTGARPSAPGESFVAIYRFRFSGPSEFAPLGSGVAEFLSAEFVKLGVRLVERETIAAVETDDSTYYAEEVRRDPRIIPATHALFGSVGAREGRVLVSAWLFDVRSGELTSTRQVIRPVSGILEGVEELGRGLAEDLKRAPAPARPDVTR